MSDDKNIMLIVDDNRMDRLVLKTIFDNRFQIIEVDSGEEALKIVNESAEEIDIILLDLVMKNMSGLEMLKKKQQTVAFQNIPVVVISSIMSREEQLNVLDAGAVDFINKPFDPHIVIKRVESACKLHKKIRRVEMTAQDFKKKSEMDMMTEIYNKITTEEMISHVLSSSCDNVNVLLIIDIDNFKSVNDNGGHLQGDYVIKVTAETISKLFRKNDIVGRIGGDEFAVMMVDCESVEHARKKASELINLIQDKLHDDAFDKVSISVGIAAAENNDNCYEDLFSKADKALYFAKKAGKGCYREYGAECEPELLRCSADAPLVLLISRDKRTQRIISSISQASSQLMCIDDIKALKFISSPLVKRVKLVIADVSDVAGDTAAYWQNINSCEWLDSSKTLAVCRESDMTQFRAALTANVADILESPISAEIVKRKILKADK